MSASSDGRSRWYVIQCKPQQETRALGNLERQGFHCYLPTLAIEKHRLGARVEVQESLFPGYLFIRLDDTTDNWHPIRSTRGVIQIVRFNEYPLPVADGIIEKIRIRLEADRPAVAHLEPGELVVITEGPFSNLEAIFIANEGTRRVNLLMNILQREQVLSFPTASVRKRPPGVDARRARLAV